MLNKCLEEVRKRTDFVPDIALILGTGLGDLARELEVVSVIDYHDLPGFPVSTVKAHKGQFVFGYFGKAKVVIMEGRVHYYEGYSKEEMRMPVRLMKMMGAKVLFLTNACGGINKDLHPGDFMMIKDHISCFIPNPLVGPNDENFGSRCVDMTRVYDKELCEILEETAKDLKIELKSGVYVQLVGPSLETPAEYKMLAGFGADAVGLSTVVEAIVARHCNLRVCGISCITDVATTLDSTPLTLQEIISNTRRVAPDLRKLIRTSIEKIAERLD